MKKGIHLLHCMDRAPGDEFANVIALSGVLRSNGARGSIAAAVRIDSPEVEHVVSRATEFAQRSGEACYVISVVPSLPHGSPGDKERVRRNLDFIASRQATPIMQEGSEVPVALVSAARWFGVRTLFVQNGRHRLFRRSIPEQLLSLAPPFEVVVLRRGEGVSEAQRSDRL